MKYSNEELLKLLENAEETEGPTEYFNDVVPFLVKYNITEGEHSVGKNILYRLYRQYSSNPVKSNVFHTNVSQFVPKRHSDYNVYYLINMSAFKVSKLLYKAFNNNNPNKFTNKKLNHFRAFLTTHGIERGTAWIEGFVLYEIYKNMYKRMKKKHLLGYDMFHKYLKLNFEYKRKVSNRSLWFGVNKSYKKFISDDEINEVRESRKKTRGSKKKKTKKRREK